MTFRFPQFPETRVTRQVECVSCKYVFAVSEDVPDRAGSRSSWWTRLSGQSPFVMRQPRRDLQRQPVVPQPDNRPHDAHAKDPWQHGVHHTMNCPRCGADNRNWIHVLNTPLNWWSIQPAQAGLLIAIALFLLSGWQLYQNNISAEYWVLLAIFFFLFGWVLPRYLVHQWKTVRKHKYTPPTPAGAPPRRQKTPAFVWTAAVLYLFGTLIFLILATIAIPWASNFVERSINPAPETLQARVDNLLAAYEKAEETGAEMPSLSLANMAALTNVVNSVEQSCDLAPVATMIAFLENRVGGGPVDQNGLLLQNALIDLRALQANTNTPCQSKLITRAEISLNLLRQQQHKACEDNQDFAACTFRGFLDDNIAELELITPYTSQPSALQMEDVSANPGLLFTRLQPITTAVPNEATQQIIESNLPPIEQAVGTATSSKGWFTAGSSYLKIWLVNIGLAGLISITTAIAATYSYADEADRNLPRPIYESVTWLAGVVAWEAVNTLKIREDYLEEIQWTGAARNELGGIDIMGLFRDMPEEFPNGSLSEFVQAQRYMIKSNEWGEIVEAAIFDQEVPRPAGFSPCQSRPVPVPPSALPGGQSRLNLPS